MEDYSTEDIMKMIDSGKKVVLDFNAPWCGPCVSFSPIFDKVSKEEDFSKIFFAKINVDTKAELPMKYGVRNVPTILFFEKGLQKSKKVGAMSKNDFENFLNENVSK